MFKIDRARNEGPAYAVFKIFNYLIMFLVIVVTLFPYLNVLAKALNDGQDTMRGGIGIWPREFTLENFKILLSDESMYLATVVTVGRLIAGTLMSLLVQFMAAYALSRKVKGSRVINIYYMIPMFIGGGLIPQYILFSNLKLLDNFWVYVLPFLFSFYNTTIIRSYIETSISNSIIEAAQIDGIGEWKLFLRIIIPLSMPILATVALWEMVFHWNDWTGTLYYIDNSNLHTLQYKLMQAVKETERMTALIQEAVQSGENVDEMVNSLKVTTESLTAAQVIVVTIPIIMVYPFLQKYFTKGITLGAVKG